MRERAAGVVRRINKHALHLPRKLRLQSLQRQQVIAEDELIVEDVTIRHPMLRVITFRRVFQQNARLQLGPVLLADPGEFEFLFFWMVHFLAFKLHVNRRGVCENHYPEARFKFGNSSIK